jgi:hypothetical protein
VARVAGVTMTVQHEAAQLVVGAALLDPRFCGRLLRTPTAALAVVERQPGAPQHVRLTDADRRALGALRARTLQEFARGVERLRRTVSQAGLAAPPLGDATAGAL